MRWGILALMWAVVWSTGGLAATDTHGASGGKSVQVSPSVKKQKSQIRWQKAKIVVDAATVYAEPHFDAEPVATLAKGRSVWVINKLQNMGFFLIRWGTAPEERGFVTDLDIDFPGKMLPPSGPFKEDELSETTDPFLDSLEGEGEEPTQLSAKKEQAASTTSPKSKGLKKTASKKNALQGGSFDREDATAWSEEERRLWGLRLHSLNYQEKILGGTRREVLSALGFSWQGPGWLDWLGFVDLGLLVSPKAPRFWKEKLGHEPQGALFLAHAFVATSMSLSPRWSWHYGFGPLWKAQWWDLEAQTSSGVKEYPGAFQLVMGAGTLAGVAWNHHGGALRLDWQFWWEKTQYSSLSLGYLWAW